MDARQLLCEALVACTRGIMGEGGGDCLFNLCLEINTVVLFILENACSVFWKKIIKQIVIFVHLIQA